MQKKGIVLLTVLLLVFSGGLLQFSSLQANEYDMDEVLKIAENTVANIKGYERGNMISQGSGFVIDSEGILVTSYRIVENVDTIKVSFGSMHDETAQIITADKDSNLALLKIQPVESNLLPLATTFQSMEPGDPVLIMGNLEGLESTFTHGTISSIHTRKEWEKTLIQMSASFPPEGSGGPLLNMQGDVIGVNLYMPMGGDSRYFAVPVDSLHALYQPQRIEYTHQPGELAAVLSWEGNFDLDLEIWLEDYIYLGNSYWFGDSPDITHGGEGEEWFVFKDYPDGDFSSGRYIISPYFCGPDTNESVIAHLTIFFPDGESQTMQQELKFTSPQNQWFAGVINVDEKSFEVLEVFEDYTMFYNHQEGDLAVVLHWEEAFDLDLEILTEDYNSLGYAYWFGDSPDITHGGEGEEWFIFKDYPDGDFSSGQYMVAAYLYGYDSGESIMANITIYYPDGESHTIQQELIDSSHNHWIAGVVDVDEKSFEVLDYFKEYSMFYSHQEGELAVVLNWEGGYDLDLEILSEYYDTLAYSYWFGDSPDIIHGDEGEEWFVFKDYPDRDFSSGQYMVAAYLYGDFQGETVIADMTIYYPDGESQTIQQELITQSHNHWIAGVINVDEKSFEVLDYFKEYSLFYSHQEGELAVVLNWEGDYDLDLEILSEDYDSLGYSYWFGDSPDIIHGDEGEEWFIFRDYPDEDFSSGQYIVAVYLYGEEPGETVIAELTIYYPDGEIQTIQQELVTQSYNHWFALLVDVDDQSIEILP